MVAGHIRVGYCRRMAGNNRRRRNMSWHMRPQKGRSDTGHNDRLLVWSWGIANLALCIRFDRVRKGDHPSIRWVRRLQRLVQCLRRWCIVHCHRTSRHTNRRERSCGVGPCLLVQERIFQFHLASRRYDMVWCTDFRSKRHRHKRRWCNRRSSNTTQLRWVLGAPVDCRSMWQVRANRSLV